VTRWYQHGYHTRSAHAVVFFFMTRLPKFVHPPIALVTALIFFLLLKNERRALVSNLRRVCGGSGARLLLKAYRVFYSFCDFVVSYCFVPRASHARLLSMLRDPDCGADKIDACLAKGKGLIVWTAHLGNWEFASRLLEMHGRPVNIARVVERGNPAEQMLREMMSNERLRVVDLNDPLASIRLFSALRGNEIVAMQGDRKYHGFSADLPFFGETAGFPLGPFLVSYVSGAPILPGVVVREGWLRYRAIVGEPIELAHTGDRDADLRAGLQKAVEFLQTTLRVYHDQWLNFFEFWGPSAPCPKREVAGATADESACANEQKA
jgi:KDO2-lipid IV(A) lauroyltransferase